MVKPEQLEETNIKTPTTPSLELKTEKRQYKKSSQKTNSIREEERTGKHFPVLSKNGFYILFDLY